MKLRGWMMQAGLATLAFTVTVFLTLGCGQPRSADDKVAGEAKTGDDKAAAQTATEKKIEAARSRLSPEDRALVDAQDFCAVHRDKKLGSMGVPLKLAIKGQPVFLCYKGCKGTAEDEPDETLKAALELKARNKKK